jgi:predicted NAD/FAD-binding protein
MIAVSTPPNQRIAIIGAGISGLVCAHLLHRRHDVAVFEANDYIGGHTHTVDVEQRGERHAVDTGFIVYNERNYPNFTRLLAQLNVETQASDMSFSVRCDRSGLEYNGTNLNKLFAQRRNLLSPRFHGMIRDILRFNRQAKAIINEGDDELTVAAFLERHDYGSRFIEHYLLPMGAAIWSCPTGTFLSFPMRFVAEFFDNHAMLQVGGRPQWRVIRGGSARYVEKLTAPWRKRIRLRTPVWSIRRHDDHVAIATDSHRTERFDQVILACHSDQALRMLDDPSPVEREVLGAFAYQGNRTVLHTDASVLPRTRRAWASWNYHVQAPQREQATVTYNMNILQSLPARETYCVTLNNDDAISSQRVLGRYEYHHPVFQAGRASAQRRHDELIQANRTSFCGAYWGYGFHEDGVNSALAVGRRFGEVL